MLTVDPTLLHNSAALIEELEQFLSRAPDVPKRAAQNYNPEAVHNFEQELHRCKQELFSLSEAELGRMLHDSYGLQPFESRLELYDTNDNDFANMILNRNFSPIHDFEILLTRCREYQNLTTQALKSLTYHCKQLNRFRLIPLKRLQTVLGQLLTYRKALLAYQDQLAMLELNMITRQTVEILHAFCLLYRYYAGLIHLLSFQECLHPLVELAAQIERIKRIIHDARIATSIQTDRVQSSYALLELSILQDRIFDLI